MPAEASANLARYDGVRYGHSVRLDGGDFIADYLATRGEGFGPEVKRRIMLGTYALSAGYYDAFYLKAQKVRTLIKRDFDEVFGSGIDALVAPTSPSVAFRFGARTADPVAMYLSDACTLPANMAGIAGVSRAVRPVRGPARSGCSSSARRGRSSSSCASAARTRRITAVGRRGARLEPAQLALADDPAGPTPAERAAALAA